MSKDFLKHELRSFLTTFVSVLAVDAIAELTVLYSGDWSRAALYALGIAFLRSFIKTVLQILLPAVFPPYKKPSGIDKVINRKVKK